MRQYVYVSTAEQLGQDDIAAILESCQRNNAAHQVTGLLLYNGRNFLQLLEGERNDLEWVMRRIEHDSRHHGISRLYDEPTSARACPDWLMKRIALGIQAKPAANGLRPSFQKHSIRPCAGLS